MSSLARVAVVLLLVAVVAFAAFGLMQMGDSSEESPCDDQAALVSTIRNGESVEACP